MRWSYWYSQTDDGLRIDLEAEVAGTCCGSQLTTIILRFVHSEQECFLVKSKRRLQTVIFGAMLAVPAFL